MVTEALSAEFQELEARDRRTVDVNRVFEVQSVAGTEIAVQCARGDARDVQRITIGAEVDVQARVTATQVSTSSLKPKANVWFVPPLVSVTTFWTPLVPSG